MLITKATQLMTIPTTAGIEGAGSVQHSAFPHSFHPHYARILLVQSSNQQNSADARDMALRKLAALLRENMDALQIDNAKDIERAIANGLAHPERLVGMHFFNPVPLMKLVEVVSGLQTAPAVAEAIRLTSPAMPSKPRRMPMTSLLPAPRELS